MSLLSVRFLHFALFAFAWIYAEHAYASSPVVVVSDDEFIALPVERIREGEFLLKGERITDRSLRHLNSLPSVRHVTFQSTSITDAGLRNSEPLRLKSVVLRNNSKISGDCILDALSPDTLEHLSITAAEQKAIDIVDKLVKFKKLQSLRMSPSAGDAKRLGDLKGLKVLSVSGPNVNDDAISSIASLGGLKELTLHCTEVTDKGIAVLRFLDSLENLVIFHAKISEKGLAAIGIKEKITSLTLWSTSGLKDSSYLRQFPNLHSLVLHNEIADEDLSHVSRLKTLRTLSAVSNGITDAGVMHLLSIKSIGRIRIEGTPRLSTSILHRIEERKIQMITFSENEPRSLLVD